MKRSAGFIAFVACIATISITATSRVQRIDGPLQYVPYRTHLKRELLSGRLPLRNPWVFLGTPFLANPQTRCLDPLHLLFLPLKDKTAVTLEILASLLLGGVATGATARLLGGDRTAERIAGSGFVTSGSLLALAGHPHAIEAACLFPLLLLCALSRRHVPLVLAVSLSILAGHPYIAIYSAIAAFLVLLPLLASTGRLGELGKITCSAIMGLLLAAAMWLPAIEFASVSNRARGLSEGHVALGSLDPGALLEPLLVRWLTARSEGPSVAALSPLLCLLALLALLRVSGFRSADAPEVRTVPGIEHPKLLHGQRPSSRNAILETDRAGRIKALVLAFAFLAMAQLALGPFGPLGHLLGRLPILSSIRQPRFALVPAAALLAVLAAQADRSRLLLAAILLLPAAALPLAIQGKLDQVLVPGATNGLLRVSSIGLAILALLLGAVSALRTRTRDTAILVLIPLTGLLWSQAFSHPPGEGRLSLDQATVERARGRILTHTPGLGPLSPNVAIVAKRQNIAGYDPIYPETTRRILLRLAPYSTTDGSGRLNLERFGLLLERPIVDDRSLPLLDYLGVQRILVPTLARPDLLFRRGFPYRRYYRADSTDQAWVRTRDVSPWHVYPADRAALPAPGDPEQAALLTVDPSLPSETVEIRSPSPVLVLYATTPLPGIGFDMDGRFLEARPVAPGFTAARVPAGNHHLSISYRPLSFRLGLFLSLSSLLLLAFLRVQAFRRKPHGVSVK